MNYICFALHRNTPEGHQHRKEDPRRQEEQRGRGLPALLHRRSGPGRGDPGSAAQDPLSVLGHGQLPQEVRLAATRV